MNAPALPRVRAAHSALVTNAKTDPKAFFLKGARLGMRVARSIRFRVQNAVKPDRILRLKRSIAFPIRNTIRRNRPVSTSMGGVPYKLAVGSAVASEIWAGPYPETQELELILDALGPGMTFVDVGANVGLFSIPAARKVGQGRVLAFEPTPSTYAILLENLQLNQITNVQTLSLALADNSGNAVLNLNAEGKDGLNTLGHPTHPDSEVVSQQIVQVEILDDILRRNSVIHVDAMKIDVEGAELFVLRGAARLLADPYAPLIVVECSRLTSGFGYHQVEIIWLLQAHGYLTYFIDSKTGAVREATRCPAHDTNLIAIKPTHPFYSALRNRFA
jgi:FkbM family methyltransferase